jgi:peptide/nickel transport system substrate-binding protein
VVNTQLTRRDLSAAVAAMALWPRTGSMQTPGAMRAQLVIDLSGQPDNIDPALARSYRDWSVVHSIHDSIVQIDETGAAVPLAAESFEPVDELNWEVVLRPGLTFHDGSPVTADAIVRGVTHVQESEGPAAGSFAIIDHVEVIDELTARIVTSAPAPWLPSQLAVWFVLLPESFTPEGLESAPVGCGPFRFVSRESGSSITLERFPEYPADSIKGGAIAEQVTFRFVPELATRIADLSTGTAQIIDSVDTDQAPAIEDAGGSLVEAPVAGSAFLRVVNDVAPFDDPRVVRALNHAIDVEAIASTLVSPESHRLASLFPDERSVAFDPDLEPFAFDVELARSLLAESGYEDGFETRLQFTVGTREDVIESIAASLAEIGVQVTLEATELATFNGSWTDPDSAPLRFVTWRPLFDPHTLLNLMFSLSGPLSRYHDEEANRLISEAGAASAPEDRAALYRELGMHFQQSPPAIFLWNLVALYGTRDIGAQWKPRGDEYIIPTSQESAA